MISLNKSNNIASLFKTAIIVFVVLGKMTWWAFGCQIVWRLAMVASRVVTLVLFASVYKSWLLLVIGLHWFGMTFWIVRQKPSFCSDNKILKSMYPVVVGFIYVFCFFNVKDGFSRIRLVVFYLIMFVENCALMGLWLPYRHEYGVVFVAALAVVFGGFFLGVIALVLYYQCYHPTLPRQGIFLRTSHDVPPMEGIVDRMICCNTCCRVREESSPPPSSQLHVDIQASRGSLRRDVARVEANASTSPTFESEILIHKPSQLQKQYSLEKERIKKERAEKARRRHSMESSVGRRIAKSAVVHEDDIKNGTLSQPSSLPKEFELSQLGDLEQRNENGSIHRIDTDKPKDTLVGSSDSSRKAEVTYIGNGHDPAVGNSYVTPQESNSYNSVPFGSNIHPQRDLDRNHNASSALEHDKDNKKKTCDDGVHCGTDDEMETKTSSDDGIHYSTDKEKETKTSCNDGIHCGTDDEKETKPKSFSSVSQSTPNRGRKSFTKSKYHASDKCPLLDSQVQNTQNPTAHVVRLPKYADNVNFQHRYSIVSDCISLSSSTSSDNEYEGYMERQSTLKDKSSLHDCQGSNVGNKTMDSEQLLERDNLSSNSVECEQKAGSLPSDQDIKSSPKKRSDNRKSRQSNRVSFPNFVASNLKRGRFSSLRRSNENCTEKSEDTRRHTVDFSLVNSEKPSDGTSSSIFSKTL